MTNVPSVTLMWPVVVAHSKSCTVPQSRSMHHPSLAYTIAY